MAEVELGRDALVRAEAHQFIEQSFTILCAFLTNDKSPATALAS